MLDRATDMPSARRSIRFFDAVSFGSSLCEKNGLHRPVRIILGAVLKTAEEVQRG